MSSPRKKPQFAHHFSVKIDLSNGLDLERSRKSDFRKSETCALKTKSSKILSFLNAKHKLMSEL